MKSLASGAVRWLIALLAVAGVGIGFYSYRRQASNQRIWTEMVAIIEEMDLPAEWRDEAVRLFQAAHTDVFNAALDWTKVHGRKFDTNAYYQDVFQRMCTQAREEGQAPLADRLETERLRFSLSVLER